MAVIAIQTQPRCKLCKHSRRPEIDLLLENRSNGDHIAGQRVNIDYVLKTLGEWGIENPTKENVTTHWRKHCQKIEEEDKKKQEEALLAKVDEIVAKVAGGGVDVEGDLDFLWAVGIEAVRDRIAAGLASGVTVDHLMKIASEKTRRGQNEAQSELLKALAGGSALAIAGEVKFAGVLPGGQPDVHVPELEEGDVIEGEFVES